MNYFKLTIRTMVDEILEVTVAGKDIADVAERLKGSQITFIPNREYQHKSFTIFSHYIKTIRYESFTLSVFDNHPTIYEIVSL